MTTPLMPKATAVWLIDNTSLTFRQIADFCGLHELEVKGIADGDVAIGIKGMDPIATGQITREQLERAQEDPSRQLVLIVKRKDVPASEKRKGPRYTPVSRRQDRPNAIAWLVRNHTELTDGQISKLVGTTKPTINAIRERSHWNMANIKPADPVILGLCTQIELDEAVRKAAAKAERALKKAGGAVLKPTAESLQESNLITAEQVARENAVEEAPAEAPLEPQPVSTPAETDEPDAASVFAGFADKKPADED